MFIVTTSLGSPINNFDIFMIHAVGDIAKYIVVFNHPDCKCLYLSMLYNNFQTFISSHMFSLLDHDMIEV